MVPNFLNSLLLYHKNATKSLKKLGELKIIINTG